MIDPSDAPAYDDHFGDVVSVYQCPDCGDPLRVEFREKIPGHAIGLACPKGHVGMVVRLRDAARLDEAFESEQVPKCWNCREEIHASLPPETDCGHPLHPGECAESYREDMRRLEALQEGGV